MEESSQLHAQDTFTHWVRIPILHWIGGWVDLRASLVIMTKRKIHATTRNWTSVAQSLYRLGYLCYKKNNDWKVESWPCNDMICVHLILITNYMEHTPSCETICHTASQEIPCLLWDPKVCYHVHKSQPLATILSQMNPVCTLLPYFCKIHSNIIFPFTLTFSNWSHPVRHSD